MYFIIIPADQLVIFRWIEIYNRQLQQFLNFQDGKYELSCLRNQNQLIQLTSRKRILNQETRIIKLWRFNTWWIQRY